MRLVEVGGSGDCLAYEKIPRILLSLVGETHIGHLYNEVPSAVGNLGWVCVGEAITRGAFSNEVMSLTRNGQDAVRMKSAHKSDECSVFGCFLSGVEPLQSTTHSASDEECSLVICCNCLAKG